MPRESKANLTARTHRIIAGLRKAYPEVKCALHFGDVWQLMVATILSAQCTDKQVNKVTGPLFEKFPTLDSFAAAKRTDIEQAVHATGFYRNKAKHIQESAIALQDRFDGKVPQTMEELLTLPGVARKTASCVLGNGYGLAEGIVVDTHVIRIANRLKFTKEKDPKKIERDLMAIVPDKPEGWILFSHLIIHHGRTYCMARNPSCADCPIRCDCPSADNV
jgi:endonuclease-3